MLAIFLCHPLNRTILSLATGAVFQYPSAGTMGIALPATLPMAPV
jgi:hypothetical protein